MIDYGEVYSNIRPENIDVKETMVFVATDIEEYEQEEERGYKYNLIGYDKNEYIRLISTKNEQLESELSNAQMALCELYELVEVS